MVEIPIPMLLRLVDLALHELDSKIYLHERGAIKNPHHDGYKEEKQIYGVIYKAITGTKWEE